MAKPSISKVARQIAVLADLMHGDGAEAFEKLTDGAQAEIRVVFSTLYDELQSEVGNA
ncbi:hypothetical protein [Burkholderia anthina]|uniref:hypothetical protein n=1 Tax=Burkholderia anthina TaxID=179879 RepID=UPI00158B454F|nr:hypothetical protein [Burkholderia anthina]